MLPEYIELEVGNGVEKMPMDTFIRWACLVDAIDVIVEKCEQLGMSKNDDSWIKPNAIEKFVKERYLSMRYKIASDLQRPGLTDIRP